MSAHLCTQPVAGAASASPPTARPTHTELIKRRHVDLMRVCSDACRRRTAR